MQMDRRTDGRTRTDRWMLTDEWTDKWTDRQTDGPNDGPTDQWTNQPTDHPTDLSTDGHKIIADVMLATDRVKVVVVKVVE